MVVINGGLESFQLRWDGHKWKDAAGHVWTMDRSGSFSCDKHGTYSLHSWSIPVVDTKRLE